MANVANLGGPLISQQLQSLVRKDVGMASLSRPGRNVEVPRAIWMISPKTLNALRAVVICCVAYGGATSSATAAPSAAYESLNQVAREQFSKINLPQKEEPLVYNKAAYAGLLTKLQLNQAQTWAWERIIRAHQAKSKAMAPLFETREAVGTLSHIKAELAGVKAIYNQLPEDKKLSPYGNDLVRILKHMEVVEGALASFYKMLNQYQQREFEVHQIDMIDRRVN